VCQECQRNVSRACAVWPAAASSQPASPLPKDVPVLVISGWHDPSTPPESGELVARAFGNSRHMVIHHAGHSFNNLKGCVDEVIAAFLASLRASLSWEAARAQARRRGSRAARVKQHHQGRSPS
jgi:pimeloyl-ACP methyl ester carboxylesterase